MKIEENLINSFPGQEIEVKLTRPKKFEGAPLIDMAAYIRGIIQRKISALVIDDIVSEKLDGVTDENIYHYFETKNGRSFGKIIEKKEGVGLAYRPKRKSAYEKGKLPKVSGLCVKNERIGEPTSSYTEAENVLRSWAKECEKKIHRGQSLRIQKVKLRIFDQKSGRVFNLAVDESVPLLQPYARPLRQIEIEFKGASPNSSDSIPHVVTDIMEIAELLREHIPGLSYSSLSKFDWLRAQQD